MRLSFKRGRKGFTLVELMVVMAIMAILAAIVVPAVTGTKQVSLDSQVRQDATSIETAVGKFNADSNLAENLVTNSRTSVLGETVAMVTSNKWPEVAITDIYGTEFPSAIGTSANTVSSVTIKSAGGYGQVTLYATGGGADADLEAFVETYNAISFSALTTGGYIQEEPNGVDRLFSSSKAYHNYLWLVKKVAVDSDTDGGRVVEVYSLTTITTATADALVYEKIY